MRKLLIVMLALGLVAAPCFGEVIKKKDATYRIMLEAGVNTDELLEAAVAYSRPLWTVELRGRDTATRDVELDRSCISERCRLVALPGAELDVSLYMQPWQQRGLRHGPVLRYTRHGDEDETGFVGWRVYVGRK